MSARTSLHLGFSLSRAKRQGIGHFQLGIRQRVALTLHSMAARQDPPGFRIILPAASYAAIYRFFGVESVASNRITRFGAADGAEKILRQGVGMQSAVRGRRRILAVANPIYRTSDRRRYHDQLRAGHAGQLGGQSDNEPIPDPFWRRLVAA